MLYPPYIEGTLPAFIYDSSQTSNYITIPFAMNKTVSYNLIDGFSIRVKTVQSNQLVYSMTYLEVRDNMTEINFPISDDNFYGNYSFVPGQFYKVQIAYVKKDGEQIQTGYYSTVGIIKCTSKPIVSISGMSFEQLHSDLGYYTGIYTNTGDSTEKIYTYYFNIYDNMDKLVYSTGDILHNYEEDSVINESRDNFWLTCPLEENTIYKLVYGGTTTNGLKVETQRYRIIQQTTIPPEIQASLLVTMNQNNGYVKIQIQGDKDKNTGLEINAIGTFQILRASEMGQYKDWQIIHKFALLGSPPSTIDFKDFTVEQGKTYKYALQQYNNETGLISDKLYSESIMVDFEDCFLFDGERQLKIKYNPQISSFKQTLLEAKTNTLGGQYPFIFRNGKVSYKEFPISGMISYLMDEENLFLKDEDMGLSASTLSFNRNNTLKTGITTKNKDYFNSINEMDQVWADTLYQLYEQRELIGSQESQIANHKVRTTQLVDYNQAAERIFKLKVLEFLNDGKPKLFRSASEGNYIVRLMNSSLTPNAQLGRMLHNFSTTATEIQTFSAEALEEIGIVTSKEIDVQQMRWETVLIKDLDTQSANADGWIKINKYIATSLQCLDMLPGTTIRVTFEDNQIAPVEIEIGTTGAYYTNINKNIISIEVHIEDIKLTPQGQITYGFYGKTFNHFDTYAEFKVDDIPLIQFIGKELGDNGFKDSTIKEQLTDVRNVVINFNMLHFIKREVEPVYKFAIEKNKSSGTVQNLYFNIPYSNSTNINYSSFITKHNLKDWNDVTALPSDILVPVTENDEDKWLDTVSDLNYGKSNWYKYNNLTGRNIYAIKCAIPYIQTGIVAQPLLFYYKTNLQNYGNFVQVVPSNESVFILETQNEYIEEIRFKLPPLVTETQGRIGYFNIETYWPFTSESDYKEIFKEAIQISEFNPLKIYQIVNTSLGDKYAYLDGRAPELEFYDYSNNIYIDGSPVDISNTEEYLVTIPKEISDVRLSSGVLADVGVQKRIIVYGIENNDTYDALKKAKQNWLKAKLLLSYLLFGNDMYPKYSTIDYPIGYDIKAEYKTLANQANNELYEFNWEKEKYKELTKGYKYNKITLKNDYVTDANFVYYSNAVQDIITAEKYAYQIYLFELNKELDNLSGEGVIQ